VATTILFETMVVSLKSPCAIVMETDLIHNFQFDVQFFITMSSWLYYCITRSNHWIT